jgi:hypothetical protein
MTTKKPALRANSSVRLADWPDGSGDARIPLQYPEKYALKHRSAQKVRNLLSRYCGRGVRHG